MSCHGFALTAGGYHQHFLIGVAVDIVHINDVFFRDFELTDGHGNAGDVDHAAAHKAYLASKELGRIHHHLHTVDVGGEHSDDDTAFRLLEHIDEGLPDFGFGHGMALALHVGAFAQEGQHAVIAQHGKAGKISHFAVDGGEVDLEVAAEYDGACRAGDGNGNRTGNGVVHVDKLHMEAAQIQLIPGFDHIQRNTGDPVLLQLQINQGQSQLGAVQGHGHLTQHIGGGADVVFVTMGQQKTPDALPVLDQIGYIGDDQIHAQHIFFGENGSAVHHKDIITVFHHGDVFAKFINAAKRDDLESLFGICHRGLLQRGVREQSERNKER